MKQIDQRLGIYQLSGAVIWYTRLNAGRIKSYYGTYLRLAPKGTPDYIALIRSRQDNLVALFIEAKSDTGKVRDDQKIFISKYGTKEGIFVIVLKDIRDLDKWITKYAKNFVDSLPNDLKDI